MATPLKERNRAEFKRYKEDVDREGKSFFPYAILHDSIMSLVVIAVIIGLACVWYFTADGTKAGILGPFLAQFLQGGLNIGPNTLPKFYALHMLLIPGLIFALIGLHLYLVVRLGVTSPPWSKTAAGREREETGVREGLIRDPAVEGEP